jgi:hypothetical protein
MAAFDGGERSPLIHGDKKRLNGFGSTAQLRICCYKMLWQNLWALSFHRTRQYEDLGDYDPILPRIDKQCRKITTSSLVVLLLKSSRTLSAAVSLRLKQLARIVLYKKPRFLVSCMSLIGFRESAINQPLTRK